jgi:uncharacterized DUF497 family protein
MDVTWGDRKAASNLKKHGVSFEEAATVFSDKLASYSPQAHEGEDRMLLVGFSADQRLLLVVFVERIENEIRIVSARKATSKERQDYEEGIRS